MKYRTLVGVSLLVSSIAFSAFAQGLPKTNRPEDVGFSSERLKRVTSVIQADVDKGAIPGAVLLVARNGKIAYLEAIGFQDPDKKTPMSTDAIFRIASMTKPITAVAVMTLVEDGKIQLLDPVSMYLPEFKGVQVGVEKTSETNGTPELSLEPAQRQMTIQDLLRHTSGLTYGIFGKSLVKQAYLDAKLFDPSQSLAEFVTKISKLPLAYQPGTTWDYSMSFDVLGRIVEVVSGMPFDQYVEERIVKPIGLVDMGFYVPTEKAGRVAEPLTDQTTHQKPPMGDATARPNFLSGGGGMVSTASDYARFGQMLLNGGQLDGVRVLSPSTIAYMTSDQLPPDVALSRQMIQLFEPIGLAPDQRIGQTYGLGFMLRTQEGRNQKIGSPGEFYWVGIWGTAFWVDPKEKLLAVWMTQGAAGQGAHYQSLIRNLVYQALTGD